MDRFCFAQGDDQGPRRILLGLDVGAARGVDEEVAHVTVPEGVAQHPKGPRGIAEAAGGRGRRHPVGEVGPQRFVLALPRMPGFREEPGGVR